MKNLKQSLAYSPSKFLNEKIKNKINTLESILQIPCKVERSSLDVQFIVFDITHRKAVNKLMKNGFIQCANPSYISNGDVIIKKQANNYKNHFVECAY